jgi:dTDP-4-dehydrorhamnose 3,5-epimerase
MLFHDMYVAGLLSIKPDVYNDDRGQSMETFSLRELENAVGKPLKFVQDFHSSSKKGVLRGLHYQHPRAQGKLVRCTRGEIYDVVADLRKGSPTFGMWEAETLSERNHNLLWVPPGFAHGFLVLSDVADVSYRMTNYRYPDDEKVIRWDDPELGIVWPLSKIVEPIVSKRDCEGTSLSKASLFTVEIM